MNVTCFNKLLEPDKGFEMNLYSVLEAVRNGKNKIQIEKIRKEPDKKKRDVLKKELPGTCFGGTFSRREKAGLIKGSGFAIMDFDNLPDAEKYKEKLKSDNFIFAAWISPSGNGVKALVKIPIVSSDDEYKKYYNALLLRYPNPDSSKKTTDSSTKDVSRFSYDSYDPTLWINENSELFQEQYSEEYTLTELPAVDYYDTNDDLIRKLQKWMDQSEIYSPGNRNTYIFKFASACNRFGISKDVALNYFKSRYDLGEKEIITTVSSAYKNTIAFGTAKVENTEHFTSTMKWLSSGLSKATIRTQLIEMQYEQDVADEMIDKAQKRLDDKIETFWETELVGDDVKLYFNPRKYKHFLEGSGFFRYAYAPGDYIFVRIENNIVNEVFLPDIRAFVFNYVNSLPYKFDLINRELLYKFVFNNNIKFFSDATLEMLSEIPLNFMRDTAEHCFLFFKNTVVKISEKGIEQFNYGKLDGCIWKSQIIDRFFEELPGTQDIENCEFMRFLRNILGGKEQNIVSLMSVIGYIIHEHKDQAYSPAIILNDKKFSDDAEGGTGKGLFCKLFKYYKNVLTFDGKTWSIDKSFAFQRVDLDTKIIIIDDAAKNFDFEKLFSIITEGIPVEKKNKQEFFIPFEQSPKIICTTNYAIKGKGGSHDRRRIEFEFEPYYSINFTPRDEFGHLLFKDWDQKEWQITDNFIIRCIQFYLTNRISKPDNQNLRLKILIQNTSHEFYDWVTEDIQLESVYHRKQKMEDFNKEMGMKISMKAFNKWMNYYAKFMDCTYSTWRSGNDQSFYFKLEKVNGL